ncbi:dTDP-4-dehydrorhamnose reductase [soil metagenome]
MRLLVVGGSGQLAQCLKERWPDAILAGRPMLDVRDPATIAKAIAESAPDAVVNAAGYTAVDAAEGDQGAAFAINRDGAAAVAREAARHGVPIVHISTDYVFSGTKSGPYNEADRPDPTGAYGRSKLEGEDAVRAANPRHVILRTAWVYSPFGNNFVKTMLKLALTRPVIRVVDDQHGNPTSAHDLADGVIAAAKQFGGRDEVLGTFHFAGRGDTTWCGFAREIFAISEELGGPVAAVEAITTADYPTAAKRPANSRLDCGAFERRFGLAIPAWQESLRGCVARLLRV